MTSEKKILVCICITRNSGIFSKEITLKNYEQTFKNLPSSIQVIPKDQMSTLPSYCPSSIAKMTSGAIQYGVPTKEFAGHVIDAEPKSAVDKYKMNYKIALKFK